MSQPTNNMGTIRIFRQPKVRRMFRGQACGHFKPIGTQLQKMQKRFERLARRVGGELRRRNGEPYIPRARERKDFDRLGKRL